MRTPAPSVPDFDKKERQESQQLAVATKTFHPRLDQPGSSSANPGALMLIKAWETRRGKSIFRSLSL